MTQPLALDNSRPLTYILPNTNLQDHLSYIDQEINQYKGKVAYMIKMQQKQSMTGIDPFSYIDQIKVPETPFINSERFAQELQRVKNRVNGQSKKDQKKEKFAELDQQKLLKGKISLQNLRMTSTKIKDSLILYQQSLLKNINLQQRKQFSPMLLKQLIQSLEQQKSILKQRIERQREQINEINRLRKYEQLEAREKQEVIGQRIRLMVNKRRKLE